MRPLLTLLSLLFVLGLSAQADSTFRIFPVADTLSTDALLQATTWKDTVTTTLLRITPDGTFEEDYGEAAGKAGRYLMGRYTVDSTGNFITFSVDYFLGKSRIPFRYRDGQDFYLPYSIDSLSREALIITDQITGDVRTFIAVPDEREDPANRRVPKPDFGKLKLPEGWGG